MRENESKIVFYLGYGQGDRVFDHFRKPSDNLSIKFEKLKDEYETVIINYGLEKNEAKLIESTLINYIGIENLCNKIQGKEKKQIMTIENIDLLLSEKSKNMDDYNKDILWECRGAAKFDKSTDDFLYFYNTLHKKIIKRELVRKPKYIFIVIKGQIHSVYDIVDVELIQPERNGRKFPKRYQINKIELNSEQTRKFRGNVVTDIFKKGAQSSTKYGNGLLNN